MKQKGFTIVELLIVIVVIAIIAVITIVTYGNISKRTGNSARKLELNTVVRLLELYKVDKGDYPSIASVIQGTNNQTRYCIGTNFPNDICSNGIWAGNTKFTDMLAQEGKVPDQHVQTSNGESGSFVDLYKGGYGFNLETVVEGSSAADCPAQAPNLFYTYPNTGVIICGKAYKYNGQYGVGVY